MKCEDVLSQSSCLVQGAAKEDRKTESRGNKDGLNKNSEKGNANRKGKTDNGKLKETMSTRQREREQKARG